jgi:hypothetical protein
MSQLSETLDEIDAIFVMAEEYSKLNLDPHERDAYEAFVKSIRTKVRRAIFALPTSVITELSESVREIVDKRDAAIAKRA